MKKEVEQQLLTINDRFYQRFGAAFAETRRRLQPGVERIIDRRLVDGRWLDIGCGSGVLGQRLVQKGLRGSYLGLDFSRALLEEAQKGAAKLTAADGFSLVYRFANLLEESWQSDLQTGFFDGVLSFAVLHHLPGRDNRQRILKQVYDLIKPGGFFIHSEWQFQNSPKLMSRVQPWAKVGLSDEDLEPGDVLLDWRHVTAGQPPETGLRYVHLFDGVELAGLANSTGFTIIEEFVSDGANGNLALYQVWQK